MLIQVGKKHGNGYHGNVTQNITVKHSKGLYDLIEYEMCPKCSMYFAKEDEEGGSYYCEYCNHEYEL